MAVPGNWRNGDVSLGGVAINRHIRWVDRYSWLPVAQGSRRLLGGGRVVYTQGLEGGRPITLTATQDGGWLSTPEVNSIMDMATAVGATYQFSFYGEVFEVLFSFDGQQAVELNPLRRVQEPETTDFFIGTIRLATV